MDIAKMGHGTWAVLKIDIRHCPPPQHPVPPNIPSPTSPPPPPSNRQLSMPYGARQIHPNNQSLLLLLTQGASPSPIRPPVISPRVFVFDGCGPVYKHPRRPASVCACAVPFRPHSNVPFYINNADFFMWTTIRQYTPGQRSPNRSL